MHPSIKEKREEKGLQQKNKKHKTKREGLLQGGKNVLLPDVLCRFSIHVMTSNI